MQKLIIFLFTILIYNFWLNIDNCFSQWQPDVRLTNAIDSSCTTYNYAWCIASEGNFVHAVWNDKRDGNNEIYYKNSTNGGLNWGTDTRLTNTTASYLNPSIAVSGLFMHIVWEDSRNGNLEVFYKRSSNGGISWETDTSLTNDEPAISQTPSIKASGSFVHVVWTDTRNGIEQIYYKRSTNGGATWESDVRLTNATGWSQTPSISVNDMCVNVVWVDTRDGNYEIYYKNSIDGGINWDIDTRLTNDYSFSIAPSIAESDSVIHIVWVDMRDGNYEIYYKKSTDNGLNWSLDTRLTSDTGFSVRPSIAVSGSYVNVVWKDSRNGNYEIYYKRSTNGGINWEADTRLTNDPYYSQSPSISVSHSVIHVLWCDTRDGNYEIYYKQNPTGNPIIIKNISTKTPNEYKLNQNYPNPFNPRTVIRFSVPNDKLTTNNVQLIVYDLQGREVQTLVNERLQTGTYETTFDGSNLTSGVYFYRLTSGEFTDVKKLILLK